MYESSLHVAWKKEPANSIHQCQTIINLLNY